MVRCVSCQVHEVPSATHAVLEYCSGGSVHRHLRSLRHGHGLPDEVGASLVQQLALALAHVHGLGIAHRDVKTTNVLYSDASRRSIKRALVAFQPVPLALADLRWH